MTLWVGVVVPKDNCQQIAFDSKFPSVLSEGRSHRRIFMIKSIMVIGTVVLLSAPVAMAQQQGRAGACAADIKAKCADVQPGEGRLGACVKTNIAGFSVPCKAKLALAAVTNKACKADVKQNCAGMERSRANARACIEKSIGNVGDQCKQALAQVVAAKK